MMTVDDITTGTFVQYGVLNDKGNSLVANHGDLFATNYFGMRGSSVGLTYYEPNANFLSYFPAYSQYILFPTSPTGDERLVGEVVSTGKYVSMANLTTSGSVNGYHTLSDAINCTNSVHARPIDLWSVAYGGGSGSSTGTLRITVVTALNADGEINGLRQINISGVRSTTNTCAISSIPSTNLASADAYRTIYGKPTIIEVPTDDPYDPDGPSEPGGGDGEFDDPVEPVPIPDPPSISAADTGFITIFNPSLSELRSLANYMWSDLFSVDSFKKVFANPMQAILGLSIVPVNVPSGGNKEVVVGNIGTGVNMTVASKQFISLDCGSLRIKGHWNGYLDYEPYTKTFLYLPYIGLHPISTDDIMGRTLHIVYNIDILSGACTAFLESDNVVLYQFLGQVASSIPITGDNFTNVINGVLNIAGSVGAMVATGGFSAPASIAAQGLGAAYQAGHYISAGASIAQDVMNMKPSIEKSGSLSGTGGIMGTQKPYIIMLRPNPAIPGGQNQYQGYPLYITARLGELNGYTEVESIHLENIPCTEKEQEEILQYLEGGVIL